MSLNSFRKFFLEISQQSKFTFTGSITNKYRNNHHQGAVTVRAQYTHLRGATGPTRLGAGSDHKSQVFGLDRFDDDNDDIKVFRS